MSSLGCFCGLYFLNCMVPHAEDHLMSLIDHGAWLFSGIYEDNVSLQVEPFGFQ